MANNYQPTDEFVIMVRSTGTYDQHHDACEHVVGITGVYVGFDHKGQDGNWSTKSIVVTYAKIMENATLAKIFAAKKEVDVWPFPEDEVNCYVSFKENK